MTAPRHVNPMSDAALLRLAEFLENETDIDYEMTTKRVKRGLSSKVTLNWPKNEPQIVISCKDGTEWLASTAAKIVNLLDGIDLPPWTT